MLTMRMVVVTRLFVMFLLTAVWWLPRPAQGAATISFLQAATGSSDGQASSLSANAITTTAGDLLVAAVTWDTGAGSTVSVSDSRGNAWTAATTRQLDSRNNQALQLFYARNIAGGLDTVKATPSPAAAYLRLVVHEVAGADLTAPLDQTAVNNTGSGSSVSVGPVTTSANGEYIFTAAMNDGATSSATFSAGTGYSQACRSRLCPQRTRLRRPRAERSGGCLLGLDLECFFEHPGPDGQPSRRGGPPRRPSLLSPPTLRSSVPVSRRSVLGGRRQSFPDPVHR